MVEEHRNTALGDEIEAINAIYGQKTLHAAKRVDGVVVTVLRLPGTPFAFTLAFLPSYPDTEPRLEGVHSVLEGGEIGKGTAAEKLLADILKKIRVESQVCLFGLIEEARLALGQSEEASGSGDSKDDVKSKASAAFQPETINSRRKEDTSAAMYAALIRTHHITSRKKVATLKAAAKQIGCAALLRSGGPPGVMYVESKRLEKVKQWVDAVHELRYKDYQLVSPPAVLPARRPVAAAQDCFDFDEVGSVKDFGAKMEEKGIVDWWRKAMGYVSD